MIVTAVHVYVKPEYIDEFIRASTKNHLSSIAEAGNMRFDVLQDAGDPAKFMLYEAYENENYAAAHKQTAHYLEWREKVAPWMAIPREGIKYSAICP